MDNQGYEMDVIENGNGKVMDGGKAQLPTEAKTPMAGTLPLPREVRIAEEMARYEEVKGVAETGNAGKLDKLLNEYEEQGWLRDWRNEENLTLYADAITDSYLEVIKVLLEYEVPMGDALIRAIDLEYNDAVKVFVKFLDEQDEDILDEIVNGHGDNDDYHPALTPLVLAAQRNNFGMVQMLTELGAEILEPSISLGGDISLTQATSALHIYRALSQPAHILATQTDVFGYSFLMSKKLRQLSLSWTDFGSELQEMAARLDVFAGEMLGQSASTEEILALFRYHDTDKYTDSEGKQSPLSKMFEAIRYEQKEFIAHPHSQKAIIAQYYRHTLDWNEKGFFYQMFMMFAVLLGYPIISLLYILVPVPSVVKFARQPYIMQLMSIGSDFTLLAIIIALTVIDEKSNPRSADALFALIFIWILGSAWTHVKTIMKHGAATFLSNGQNLYEAIIIILYVTVFFLQWNGPINISSNSLLLGRPEMFLPGMSQGEPSNTNPSNADGNDSPDLQAQVASTLDGLRGNLSATTVEGVSDFLLQVLTDCQASEGDDATGPSLPAYLQETVDYDQFDPFIVANALFGVTIIFAVLRMMNLLLISETVGPLRISLGSMTGDILKFCVIFIIIWFAFGIGLYQNFFTSVRSALRDCQEESGSTEKCELPGFTSFATSIMDLYFSLFGLVELDVLMVPGKYSVTEAVGTFLYILYLIIAVLVLLNALIGMLSNTYNQTEESADTEWKFYRAVLWAAYLRPVGTLPTPFNLIPSVKTLFRLCRKFVGIWISCLRPRKINKRAMHKSKELTDYMRVLKLIIDRYIQANLSTTSLNAEGIRPRDIQSLRNDIRSFRNFSEERMEELNKVLVDSWDKSTALSQKLEDLEPLDDRAVELVDNNVDLTGTVEALRDECQHLQEDQGMEISERDGEIADVRARVAALLAEAEQRRGSHAREIQGKNAREAELMDAIRGLKTDKDGLSDMVETLSRDLERLRALIPETQDEEPEETAERLGFFRRIKNTVEKTLTDLTQEAKIQVAKLDTSTKETGQVGAADQDPQNLSFEHVSGADADVGPGQEEGAVVEQKQDPKQNQEPEPHEAGEVGQGLEESTLADQKPVQERGQEADRAAEEPREQRAESQELSGLDTEPEQQEEGSKQDQGEEEDSVLQEEPLTMGDPSEQPDTESAHHADDDIEIHHKIM